MDISNKYQIPQGQENVPIEEREPPHISYGTDPAMYTIINKVLNNEIDTVCINIATLIRNAIEKSMDIRYGFEELTSNMTTIVQDLSIAFESSKVNNPAIYFYLMPYHKMTVENFCKSLSTHKQRLYIFDVCRKYIQERFSHRIPSLTNEKNGRTTVTTQIIDENVFVTRNIEMNVSKTPTKPSYYVIYGTVGTYKNSHKLAFLSHQALDAHVLSKMNGVWVNSYTGKAFVNKNLGEYFWKFENIPFTKVTHVIFGDKDLLMPGLKLKERNSIVERSVKENWRLLTTTKIDSILQSEFKLPYYLP